MTIWEAGEERPTKENEKSGKVREKSDVKTEKMFRKGVDCCDRNCIERHTQWRENIRQ